MSTKSYAKTRFSANDAALVMIDHQSGIIQCVHDYSPAEFRNNVICSRETRKSLQVAYRAEHKSWSRSKRPVYP